jgi:hypothetical protein
MCRVKKAIQSSVIMADHVFLQKRKRSRTWSRPLLCSCGGRIDVSVSSLQCPDCVNRSLPSMVKK